MQISKYGEFFIVQLRTIHLLNLHMPLTRGPSAIAESLVLCDFAAAFVFLKLRVYLKLNPASECPDVRN